MTTTDGNPTQKKPRSQAQIKADKAYQKKNKNKINKSQREHFRNIAATLPKAEAEAIAELLHAHGVKPADVIRATAYALTTSSDTATTADEIRNAARLWRDSQTATGDTSNADQTDTDTPND